MSDGSLTGERVVECPLGSIGAQDLIRVAYTKYGFLRKQSKFFSKVEGLTGKSIKWNQVFVIISQGCVYIYDSEKSKSIKQAFSLKGFNRVFRVDTRSIPCCFELQPKAYYRETLKAVQFAASTEEDRLGWMQCLYGCLMLVNHEFFRDLSYLKTLDYKSVEACIDNESGKTDKETDPHYHELKEDEMIKELKPKRYNPFPVSRKSKPKTPTEAKPPPSRIKSQSSMDMGGETYDDTIIASSQSPSRSPQSKNPPHAVSGETYDDAVSRGNTCATGATSKSFYVNEEDLKKMDLGAEKQNASNANDSESDSENLQYENEMEKLAQDYLFPYSDQLKARECLQDKPIQTFLIRNSSERGKKKYCCRLEYGKCTEEHVCYEHKHNKDEDCVIKALQIKMKDGIKKYQINIEDGKFFFVESQKFDSLTEFVLFYKENTLPDNRTYLGTGYRYFEKH